MLRFARSVLPIESSVSSRSQVRTSNPTLIGRYLQSTQVHYLQAVVAGGERGLNIIIRLRDLVI